MLDMRLRMEEGRASGVPWGDGLGKGHGGRPGDLLDKIMRRLRIVRITVL